MKIKNIKVRYIFERDIIEKANRQIIWRSGKSTFSIYKDATKFINVTGLKSLQEIKHQKLAMEKLFKQNIITVKIDNIFYSKKDYKNLDMHSLYNYLTLSYLGGGAKRHHFSTLVVTPKRLHLLF